MITGGVTPPVNVRVVELAPLFNHTSTRLELPPDGIVYVSGANESGKTALLDAIATGLWGETVTGRSPWPADRGCVRVETDTLTVTRTRKSRTNVTWHRHGEAPVEWESPSKASAALADEVGSFNVWARTKVFHRRTGEAFLASRDADRKRLLEEILGLDAFEAAFRRATEAVAVANTERQRAEGEARVARARAEAARAAANAVTTAAPLAPQPAPTPAEVEAARRDAESAVEDDRASRLALTEANIAARTAALAVQRLDGATVCPTCHRAFDEDPDAAEHRARELAEAKALAQGAAEATAAASIAARRTSDAVTAARSELDRLQRRTLLAEAAAESAAHAAETARAVVEAAETAERTAAEVEAAAEAPTHRHAVAVAAREVLSPTGVRGHILASALPVLAASATAWAARLRRPGWRFTLGATGTTAAGTATDRLAVTLHGTPNGGGYAELSEGARHRANLAVALALGELGADGTTGGTWIFDEALDAPLDATGAADIAEILRDMARGLGGPPRCILVFGHSPEIARVLRPDVHYECAAGTLTLRRASEGRTL